MISKILVPTDGSKTAKRSLEYAVQFARQTGATVTILSVIDKSAFIPQTIPAISVSRNLTEPIENYLRMAAESHTEYARKLCLKNEIPCRTVIRSGRPVDEIIKEAQKSKVDMIIIGSRGKSALKAAVLGSVTFGVISGGTKMPVLVVKK